MIQPSSSVLDGLIQSVHRRNEPLLLLRLVAQTGIEPASARNPNQGGGPSTTTVKFRVLNTCLYQGFRADLADREEVAIR